MEDRKLLELSAKAYGIEVEFYDTHSAKDVCKVKDNYGPAEERYWNPLTNDAQAFRLAIKLHIFDGNTFRMYRLEVTRNDPTKSDEEIARRAIVMAAADIGENR